MDINNIKQAVWQANLDLVRYKLVVFTWGNASAIDRDKGIVVIKPSGVDYALMRIQDMVVTDLDGNILEGNLKPSSDLATHLEIYRAFEGIGGIVHTHSPYATAWAQAGKDIPNIGTTHSDYFHNDIPCTAEMSKEDIMGAYEANTGRIIVDRFLHPANPAGNGKSDAPSTSNIPLVPDATPQTDILDSTHSLEQISSLNPIHTPAVLVRNHGPFTWGPTVQKAVENSVVLEQVAKMAAVSFSINPNTTMNPDLIEKHFSRKHGPDAYYGQR